MLQLFPFIVWLAAITSVVLLVVLWNLGDLRFRTAALLTAWFLVAAYCQFFAGSASVGAVGLALQTALAVTLLIRWKWIA